MDKAPEAFRTISEVAELLETPAHVLRFWESRFPQIKPVKRAGGRRYYRPADVALLSGIRHLLHAEGMTIRGVQKVLRDHGVRHVAGLSGDISDLDMDAEQGFDPESDAEAEGPVGAQILPISSVARKGTSSGASDRKAKAGLADVQPLFPPPPMAPEDSKPADAGSAAPSAIPRAGDGGFIAFSNAPGPRKGPAVAKMPPTQAILPFGNDAPEAPHIWVEPDHDEDPAIVTLHPSAPGPADGKMTGARAADQPDANLADAAMPTDDLSTTNLPDAEPSNPDRPETATPPPQPAVAAVPEPAAPTLAGLAARLRALSHSKRPRHPDLGPTLTELHSRLGLLHAQMAEALRLRR